MQKILILYFSGVGNTKYVAEQMYLSIKDMCSVDMKSIEEIDTNFSLSDYNRIILGTPTIHSEPAKPMQDFLQTIHKLEKPVPALLYVTYGLFPENIFIKFMNLCLVKNIIPVSYVGYRCKAIDAMLLVPSIKYFAKHEKNITKNIKRDVEKFIEQVNPKFVKPKYRYYSLLNYPNKYIGQRFRFRIYLFIQNNAFIMHPCFFFITLYKLELNFRICMCSWHAAEFIFAKSIVNNTINIILDIWQ